MGAVARAPREGRPDTSAGRDPSRASGRSSTRSSAPDRAESPPQPQPLVRGLVPLHHQVYAALRADLDIGRWKPESRLPTERELAEHFGCSLITVRRALDELVRERRIVRMRGRGTFACAAPVDRELAVLTSFTDEMTARGLNPRSVLVNARLSEAPRAVADALGLQPGSAVYELERVRHAGSEPLLLEQVHLPAAMFPGLLDRNLATRSLYEVMSADYGVELERGVETIEPSLPSRREAELLGQDHRSPVLLLELVSFTAAGLAVEHCRSVVRGDRARYHLEVRRSRPHLSLISSPSTQQGEPTS